MSCVRYGWRYGLADRARSLLTVRAAISWARFGDSPRSSELSLMCSYCRSRLAFEPRGIAATSSGAVRVLSSGSCGRLPGWAGPPRVKVEPFRMIR